MNSSKIENKKDVLIFYKVIKFIATISTTVKTNCLSVIQLVVNPLVLTNIYFNMNY